MFEIRWFWRHWKTWTFDRVEYEGGGGVFALYLGCLCLAYHYLE